MKNTSVLQALILAAASLLPAISQAEALSLRINFADLKSHTVEIDKSFRASVAAGMLNITTPDGNEAYSIPSVRSMEFLTGSASVESVTAESATVAFLPGRLEITCPGAPCAGEITGIDGVTRIRFEVDGAASVDVSMLPAGTYILSIGDNATFSPLKFLIR